MGTDLSRAEWRKSTFSNGTGGNCVEVATNLPGRVLVRDSKRPDAAGITVSSQRWQRFLQTLKRDGLAGG